MPEMPPTLYLSDRVNGWWPGIDTRCAACLPSHDLTALEI